ncbi:MAG: FAD-dependent oxidoreductase, partial [Syntrophales bacterium]|nr:FAD-dependent oxidoreductase [Syntrophales bacterium]
MEKFEVIVVGGGLAGLSAAYTLAGAGVEVLVLERGDYSGAKNVTGGRIYTGPIRSMFPELWEDTPFERCITKEGITLLANGKTLTFNYTDPYLSEEPCRSYSVLRARFDRWLADKVESRGAIICLLYTS